MLVRTLLSYFSVEWIILLLDLFATLHRWLPGNPDMYEILEYESTLELTDTKGKMALFKKRQRVRFLQNNIIAFEDYAWGDGEILAGYKCTPGVVVDKYQEGDRWNILISLRETKSKGDIEEFHIERTEKNTFTKAEEWLQTEVRRRTHRLKMNVIFPHGRHCKRAILTQRRHNRATVLGTEHFRLLPDGRQLVIWETTRVYPFDIYTLKWQW
ncbi:MAG: hypothetical protein DCC55_40050 [Chloroflexi bacterium]|nr:MAG: hypothetical protein DCC55_40050 [Chloroflexota bacterium]